METSSRACPRCTGGLIGWGRNERWCAHCQGRGTVVMPAPIAGGSDLDVVNGLPLLGMKLKRAANEFLEAGSRVEWEPRMAGIWLALAVTEMLSLLEEYDAVWKSAVQQYEKEVQRNEMELMKP